MLCQNFALILPQCNGKEMQRNAWNIYIRMWSKRNTWNQLLQKSPCTKFTVQWRKWSESERILSCKFHIDVKHGDRSEWRIYHTEFTLRRIVSERIFCVAIVLRLTNISLHWAVEAYDEFPYKVPVYIQNHNCRRAKTHPLLEGKTYIKEIYKTMSHS